MTLTADQKALRLHGIGASELPAVLGLDPYRSALDVWAAKTELVQEDGGTIHTRLGTLLEPVILTLYAEASGAQVYPSPGTLRHPTEAWLLATPDALAAADEHATIDRVVEAKHRGHWNRAGWGESHTDQVPDAVAVQVYAQLAVTGYRFGDVAALLSGSDVRFYRLHADAELMEIMLQRGRAFWEDHVKTRQPPEVVAADNARLGRLFRQATEVLKPASPAVEAALDQLRVAKQRLAELEQERDLLEALIKSAIGEDSGVECPFGRATWNTTKDSVEVDHKAVANYLLAELPAEVRARILLDHTRPKPGVRRFLVSGGTA